MGRIRSIKPEFPHSEKIARVTRDARLCFILLWTLADDEGRLRGSSRLLSSLLYPYDDDVTGAVIEMWLAELQKEACVELYQVTGVDYIQICGFLEHQKIDKPSKSRLPSPSPREGSAADLGSRILDLGSRILDQEPTSPTAPSRKPAAEKKKPKPSKPAKPVKVTPPVSAPAPEPKPAKVAKPMKRRVEEGWKLSAENLDYGRRIGLSEVECAREWVKFYGHHKAKGSEFVDWNAAWQNWARKSMEFLGRTPNDPNSPRDGASPREVSFSLEQWKRVLVIYASTNNWNASWGPAPGEKGCKVPRELIVEKEPQFAMEMADDQRPQ